MGTRIGDIAHAQTYKEVPAFKHPNRLILVLSVCFDRSLDSSSQFCREYTRGDGHLFRKPAAAVDGWLRFYLLNAF